MGFTEIHQPSLFQSPLGPATATVLGASGLRLNGLTSFHLDEGPDFAWLNIYRTLADARQLEITREREPAEVALENGAVTIRWSPCDEVQGDLAATYRVVPEETAIDATFSFTAAAPYENIEYCGDEDESWARDDAAAAIFRDGRWQTGYPLNWRRGPHYFHPLTLQEHKYGHAIVLMARREDCFGLSGYHTYHNAQYFHLFGHTTAPGDRLSTTLRLILITEWDDLEAETLAHYQRWLKAQ